MRGDQRSSYNKTGMGIGREDNKKTYYRSRLVSSSALVQDVRSCMRSQTCTSPSKSMRRRAARAE